MWTVQLPKIGKVQINLHRPIPEGFTVKQVRIVKKADRWFATIAIQSEFDFPEVKPHGHEIGIDVGLISYVSSSDGFQVKRPKFFKTAQSRLKVLRQFLCMNLHTQNTPYKSDCLERKKVARITRKPD